MTRQQKTVSKIIELKGFSKEQLEAEVRKARVRLDAEEENLDGLECEYKRMTDDFCLRQTSGALAVHEIGLFYTYMKHMSRQVESQKGIVAMRASELEEKQKSLVVAYKEQRLLEILQDKMDGVQAKDAVRKDQKESDCQFLMRKLKQ